MIPPQVNGATWRRDTKNSCGVPCAFPMIPPQVNGATNLPQSHQPNAAQWFPMIPPQVNGATTGLTLTVVESESFQ